MQDGIDIDCSVSDDGDGDDAQPAITATPPVVAASQSDGKPF